MRIDRENMAVILAALRYWQADIAAEHPMWDREEIRDIATDGGEFPMPDASYIDDLCEALNCGDFDALNGVTLAILLEDGLVHNVISDHPKAFAGLKVITLDYEGEDTLVPQPDGTVARAHTCQWQIEEALIGLAGLKEIEP